MFYLLQLLLNNFIFAIASIAFQKPARGPLALKRTVRLGTFCIRLMTEYCIISHSFSPESRLCTYHILLPPAKPMQSDDIVQHLMHEMLAHLRASSKIAKPRTAYDVRTVNQTPPKAAAVVMLLIHRGGAALVWAVAGTGCGGLTSLITCGPGTRGLGSLADN